MERLLNKIKISKNGCWVWTGAVFKKSNGSYGQIRIDGKLKFAHRVSYETFKKEVSLGLELDHLCRKTLCINPSHLEEVTHQENVRRGKSFNKNNKCKRGHVYIQNVRDCPQCKKITFARWYKKNRNNVLKSMKSYYLNKKTCG